MFSIKAQRYLTWFFAIVSYLFALYLYLSAPEHFTAEQRLTWELISCVLTGLFGFFLLGGLRMVAEMDYEAWKVRSAQIALGMICFGLNYYWWQTDFAPVGRFIPQFAAPAEKKDKEQNTKQKPAPLNDYAELTGQLAAELQLDPERLNWFQSDLICALPAQLLTSRYIELAGQIGKRPAPLPAALKLIAEQEYLQAARSFDEAARSRPDDLPRIEELRVLAFLRVGQFPRAGQALEKIEFNKIYDAQLLYPLAAAGIYTAKLIPAGVALDRLAQLQTTAGTQRTTEGLARMNLRAMWLIESNRYREAEQELEQAYGLSNELFGSMHPSSLALLNNQALLKTGLGDYANAEKLAQQLKWGAENEHNGTALQAAQSMRALAGVWMMLGNLNEAESAARIALRLDQRGGVELSPDVAKDRIALAAIVQIQNRFDEAELNLRFALDSDRELYGLDHPQVARDYINLAVALSKLNHREEARLMAEQALERARATLGADHPGYGLILGSAAVLDQRAERFDLAGERFKEALAILEKALGGEHVKLAIVLNNYASLLKELNRPEEAEDACRRALHIFRDAFSEAHPWFQVAQKNLVEIKQDIEKRKADAQKAEMAENK